jgi:hypothetical protein
MERLRWVNEKQTGAAMAATRKALDAESTLEKKLEDADAALRRAEEETAAAQAVEEQEALRKNIEAAKEINDEERELVEAKDAELQRVGRELQTVTESEYPILVGGSGGGRGGVGGGGDGGVVRDGSNAAIASGMRDPARSRHLRTERAS